MKQWKKQKYIMNYNTQTIHGKTKGKDKKNKNQTTIKKKTKTNQEKRKSKHKEHSASKWNAGVATVDFRDSPLPESR